MTMNTITLCHIYRGADKSSARPGRKQARKHVRDARDFNKIETRAVIKFIFQQGKAPKKIQAILTEKLACFLPRRAKDLSAPLYQQHVKFQHVPASVFVHPRSIVLRTFTAVKTYSRCYSKFILFLSLLRTRISCLWTPITFNLPDINSNIRSDSVCATEDWQT